MKPRHKPLWKPEVGRTHIRSAGNQPGFIPRLFIEKKPEKIHSEFMEKRLEILRRAGRLVDAD